MSLFKQVFDKVLAHQEKEFNCISWLNKFPRFSSYVPGVSKGVYYAVTGGPGAAKTQFTDNAFLYHSVDFAIEHNLDLEIVYFSFELSKDMKVYQGMSKRLFDTYGVKIPLNVLRKRSGVGLDEDQVKKLSKLDNYFEKFEKYVTFYDEPMTPSQIFRIQMDRVKENGEYDIITGDYRPYNPDKYLIFIIDHIGYIQPDPGQTLHQALGVFSANNVYLRNKFGASIVSIHQQGVDGQVEQFTSKGENIASKVEPKLAGLGDNRTLGRDYDIVLGMFSPKRHEIDNHRGYKTKRFADNCRFLSVVKNREGEPDIHVCLYFNGAVGYFEEMPKAEEFFFIKNGQKTDNEVLYEKYSRGQVGILDPNKQKSFTFL